jgi:hypothetical protein
VTTQVTSHRDREIEQMAYSVAEVAIMLGFCTEDSPDNVKVSANTRTRRLIRSGQLRARTTGAAYIIPGSAVADYLDGSDDPIKHPDSA